MKILQISEDKLRLLLEKKKQYIGGSKKAYVALSIGFTLLITYLTADYKSFSWVSSDQLKIVSLVFMIACFLAAIYFLGFDRYNQNKLFDEIKELSTINDEYRALAVIKDTFSKYPNRFLVYYDEIYHCYLCLHFPVSKGEIKNTSNKDKIIEYISRELHVSKKFLSVTSIRQQKEHVKYSLRENDNKNYFFYYYNVVISNFDKYACIMNDTFTIQGKKFAWKSISELRNDINTMERNKDVVNYLESNEW